MEETKDKKPLIGQKPTEKKDDPKEIELQIRYFNHVKVCAASRKARLEELMRRRSANGWRTLRGRIAPGWSPSKKTKMVRRYMSATQELEQAVDFISQLEHRLQQITVAPKQVNDVAPFVDTDVGTA